MCKLDIVLKFCSVQAIKSHSMQIQDEIPGIMFLFYFYFLPETLLGLHPFYVYSYHVVNVNQLRAR